MGIVKYTGPVASFHCPTNAEIRSLKVHFSPKQLGEGTPSPENIRPIEGWDGVVVHNDDGNMVPEEYQKVEYLKNDSGKPYINTNITPTSNMRIYIEGKTSSNVSAPGFIFGSRNDSGSTINSEMFWAITWNSYYCYGLGTARNTRVISANINENFTLDFNCNYAHAVKFNNILSVNNNVSASFSQPIYLFGINTGGNLDSQYVSGIIIKRFVMYETYNTDTIIANFIPCRRKSDNKPGMYDTVSKTFFTNQGTGEFICGPDVGETVDYEFGVLGKNKVDPTWESGGINTNTGLAQAGSNSIRLKDKIKIFPNTTYTISWSSTGRNIYRFAYKKDGTFSRYLGLQSVSSQTVKFNTDEYYLWIYQYANTNEPENLQVELGSTATAYEPYDPNKTVYGGWVDLVSGEVCEQYHKIIADGVNVKVNRVYDTYNDVIGAGIVYLNPEGVAWPTLSSKQNIFSNNIAMYNTYGDSATRPVPRAVATNAGAQYVRFYVGYLSEHPEITTNADKLAFVNNYLQENPVTIVYELKNYVTYQIAPIEMQTFLSQNNVWSNADYVEVEYDLHETQDILARKQFIIANQPHLEEVSGSIATFNTDMSAPLKECKIEFKPVQDLHGYSKPWVGGSGKNLFNINAAQQDPSDTTLSNTTKRIFTPNTYSVGASYSNWWQPNKITDYSISNNSITVTSSTGYGVCFAIKAKPETYYTVSATVIGDNPRINNAYYDSEGNYLGSATTGGNITTFQTPENTDMMVIIFAPVNNTEATFSNIQVEEGSAATAYEPWENVCSISGWMGAEVYRTGKNFMPEWVKDANSYSIAGAYGYKYTAEYQLVPNTIYRMTMTIMSEISGLYWGIRYYTTDKTGVSDSGPFMYFVNGNNGYRQYANGFNSGPTGKIRFAVYTQGQAIQTALDKIFAGATFMLELGSTATDYELYNGETIPITFPAATSLLTKTTLITNKTLNSNGEIISETGMTVTDFIKVNEGETYKLTFTSKEGARTRRIYGYDANKEPVESLASASWVSVDSIGTLTATIPSGVEYIRVCYKTADENIFLEGPESSVIYGGYVDLVTGEVWETHQGVSAVWGDWGQTHPIGGDYSWKSLPLPNTAINGDGQSKCNLCSRIWDANKETEHHYVSAIKALVFLRNDFPNDTVVTVTCRLATPILVTTLTPTQLKTLHGTNNIWSNTNGDIELKYWTH